MAEAYELRNWRSAACLGKGCAAVDLVRARLRVGAS